VQLAWARQDVKERESSDDIRSRSDDSYSPRRHWCGLDTLPVLHPDAAGIDVGASELFVAVSADRNPHPVCARPASIGTLNGPYGSKLNIPRILQDVGCFARGAIGCRE
jgi:hypothetical protein